MLIWCRILEAEEHWSLGVRMSLKRPKRPLGCCWPGLSPLSCLSEKTFPCRRVIDGSVVVLCLPDAHGHWKGSPAASDAILASRCHNGPLPQSPRQRTVLLCGHQQIDVGNLARYGVPNPPGPRPKPLLVRVTFTICTIRRHPRRHLLLAPTEGRPSNL